MRILLTGITGYLGSNLAANLITKGHELIALKRRTSSLSRIQRILPDLKLHNLEDSNLAEIFSQYGKIDVVIHTATSYGRNGEGISDVINANMLFPLKLLNMAASLNVNTFINADTSIDRMINPYALSKGQFAEWGEYFAKQKRIRFLNLKLEHFYGVGDDKSKFITHIIQSCLTNIPELILTRGEQLRDFIHIDDVISAYLLLLDKQDSLIDGFNEFEVGSGSVISIKQLVKDVHQQTNSKTYLNFGAQNYRSGEVMFSHADTKSLEALGWSCRYSIESGIKLVIDQERKKT
jgi:CDP-paratose synthetase